MPTRGPPKRDGSCTTLIETPALLALPIVRAFLTCVSTTPSADFCCAVRTPHDVLSHHSVTPSRSPEVSSTAFDAQPPDLPPAVLMEVGFAVFGPLARCRRPHHPVFVHRLAPLLHASFRPRLATTPLRFAITSPPSGCEEDFHLQAVKHARHTKKAAIQNRGCGQNLPESRNPLFARSTGKTRPSRYRLEASSGQ